VRTARTCFYASDTPSGACASDDYRIDLLTFHREAEDTLHELIEKIDDAYALFLSLS